MTKRIKAKEKQHNADQINKLCRDLGYCPYGELVEDFPCHGIAAKYAREHNMWVKFVPPKWVKCDKNDPDAIEDLNHAIKLVEEPQSCSVFGHDCPVFYVAEPFIDDEQGE